MPLALCMRRDGANRYTRRKEKPRTSAIQTPPDTMLRAQDRLIPAKAPKEPRIAPPHRMVERRSESIRMVAPGARSNATTGTTPELLNETTEIITSEMVRNAFTAPARIPMLRATSELKSTMASGRSSSTRTGTMPATTAQSCHRSTLLSANKSPNNRRSTTRSLPLADRTVTPAA